MKLTRIILICCFVLMQSTSFAKGTVNIGYDNIEILYDAYPIKNYSDYSLSYNTISLVKSKLVKYSSKRSLSLSQLSRISNASVETLKFYTAFSKLKYINEDTKGANSLRYVMPKATKKTKIPVTEIIADGEITVWGRETEGKQLKCTITVKQSILSYLTIRSTFESFRPGNLLVVFVDPDTGLCDGAELS